MAKKRKDSFSFDNPYRYYLVNGKEKALPGKEGLEDIISYSKQYLQHFEKEINATAARDSFKAKIGAFKEKSRAIEESILQPKMQESFQKYKQSTDDEKIILLTKLYFTGDVSNTDTAMAFNYKLIAESEEKSFLFLASTKRFSSGLDSSGITISRSTIVSAANEIFSQSDDKEAILKVLSELLKNEKITFGDNDVTKELTEQLKKDLSNGLKWDTVKNNIKKRIKIFRKNNLAVAAYVINDNPKVHGGENIPIIEVGFDPSITNFKKILRDRCDKILKEIKGKKSTSFSFSSFVLYIDKNNMKNIETIINSAKRYINSAEFTKTIATKKDGVYILNVNSSTMGGALGEITARIGGENFIKNARLTGTETHYGQSSFADIQGETENGKKLGLNVKHFPENSFNLYKKYSYPILSSSVSLFQYMPKEYLLAIRFLEINYNYFDYIAKNRKINDILSDSIKSESSRSLQYTSMAQSSLPGFIRQSSEFEKEITTPFFIVNNLVIPASIVFSKILDTVERNESITFFSASSHPLPLQDLSEPINEKTNLLSGDYINNEDAGTITFDGLRISLNVLKEGKFNLTFSPAKD